MKLLVVFLAPLSFLKSLSSLFPHTPSTYYILSYGKIPRLRAQKITEEIINLTSASVNNGRKFLSALKVTQIFLMKTGALVILSRNLFVYSDNTTKFINSDI
jgi:hypothetical protein